MFITFEGVEGAGKSTQIRLLADRLRESEFGRDVLVTREPGDGPLGPQLRQLVLSPPVGVELSARTELLIMLADRAQHVDNVIVPSLATGGIVICDRFADSSLAYQGYGREMDRVLVAALNSLATNGLRPDLTILLDLDPKIGLERQKDKNRMESEPLEFHAAVRAGFLEISRHEPARIHVVQAEGSQDAVHNDIWSEVSRKLGL